MKTKPRHPFGELLAQYRARKPGLTQTHLAELAGYDQAILVRMCQGKKDLTGPSGRERVVRLIETLADQDALILLDEANALLLTADMPPLFERQINEARLITRLSLLPPGQRVRRTNLPAPLTSFVGRAHEIAEARRLLGNTRLLTITGSGGSGKTRLAQRIAADVLIAYSEGVWYAELVALTDPALIPTVVASALGLMAVDRSAREQVLDYLRERHVLLVLDNCEHLIEAVALYSVEVLRACPRVTILTTSREALNVDGETAWRVPPMQPDEAGKLFVDRAAAVRSDAYLSAGDETIATICQRLDGMPLAIELAAALLSSMSLSDIAERLHDRFNLLTGGRRGALPRHQTLRAMIDWSYDMLTEHERGLFRHLAVFVGGWTVEMAQQVYEHPNFLPLMHNLVNKSLVLVVEKEGETRYQYLETVREYARDALRLAEGGELKTAQRRHAEAYALFAEQSYKPSHGPQQLLWSARLQREYPNLHAALSWSFMPNGDVLIGCRICGNLRVFWISSSYVGDAEHWAQLAFSALNDQMPPRILGHVWLIHTAVCGSNLLPKEILVGYQRALDYYTTASDETGIADAKGQVGGWMLLINPRDPDGWRMLQESVALARTIGDPLVEHCSLKGLGEWSVFRLQFDQAEALFRENIQSCRESGDYVNLALVLGDLAHLYLERLQFNEALPYAYETAEVARMIGDFRCELFAECMIAEISRFLGDVPRAVTLNEACLAFAHDRLPPIDAWLPCLTLSKALNDAGEYERAQGVLDAWMKVLYRSRGLKTYHYTYGATFDALACVASGRGDAMRAALLFEQLMRCSWYLVTGVSCIMTGNSHLTAKKRVRHWELWRLRQPLPKAAP